MVNVIDESLLFSDLRYKVIFVNSNFEPIDMESKVFCKIYSSTYSECKRLCLSDDSMFIVRPIAKTKSVVFIRLCDSKSLCTSALDSFFKYLKNKGIEDISRDVCFLVSNVTEYLKYFIDSSLNYNAKFYYRTIA